MIHYLDVDSETYNSMEPSEWKAYAASELRIPESAIEHVSNDELYGNIQLVVTEY